VVCGKRDGACLVRESVTFGACAEVCGVIKGGEV
jgi:hypothetical protein